MGWTRRIAVALWLFAAVGVASAHPVSGSRFDAPLPLSLLYVGAGATVAATAVWLGRGGQRTDARTRPLFTLPPNDSRPLRVSLRAAFFALVAVALAHGLAAGSGGADSLATTFVWPVWFEGVALLAVLVGNPWGTLSPWRALYGLLERIEGDEVAVLGGYPSSLGTWPALVAYVLVFGALANLTVVPRSPRLTVALVAGYAAWMLVGAVAFGPTWFERADAFAVLYRLFGRVAPLSVAPADDGGYRVALRTPWRGCTGPVADLGVAAFVVVAVYTVSFDGFASTPEYRDLLFAARDALGLGAATSLLLYGVGVPLFLLSFAAASALLARLGWGSARAWPAAARAFAPTVVPIAAAYELAHAFPYVVRNAAEVVDLLATLAGVAVGEPAPLAWLPLPAFWGSQVALVVAGHLVAVVAAHRVAVARYGSLSIARRAHAPLVALMVGYTVLSLWIVSRPVVAG